MRRTISVSRLYDSKAAAGAADRRGLCYPSDLTDAEWERIAPLIRPAKRGGRLRAVNVCGVLNAIFYVLSAGCQWAALSKDLPLRSTAWAYFDLWKWDGALERIHRELYVAMREQEGRKANPTTAIIDRQSAKGAQKGAHAPPSSTPDDRCSVAPYSPPCALATALLSPRKTRSPHNAPPTARLDWPAAAGAG